MSLGEIVRDNFHKILNEYMPDQFEIVLNFSFFRNTILDYLKSILIFVITVLIIKILREVVLNYLKKITAKTKTTFDDILVDVAKRNLIPTLYFGAFYFAINNLNLSSNAIKAINSIGALVITFYGIKFLANILEQALEIFWLKGEKGTAKQKSIQGLLTLAKILIWGAGFVFLLDNLGFKVSTVIAGLGIGGVAVALAAQAILGDLFSYISILFDKPFEVGDFIIVDDKLGTVERIGIKTTRIISLDGEQLIFSNSDLTRSRIRNFKRMEKRRVLFKIGIVYQTKKEQLLEIPKTIKEIIQSVPDTIFDRAHFASYGDFSLDFEIVYYVIGNDYNKYMDIQQNINLKLFEEFAKRGIEFAYPTQTLYMKKDEITH